MGDLSVLLAAVTGLATSTILGTVKGLEQRLDAKIVSKLGNLTPIVVVALNIALPKLWAVLHLPGAVPDATVVASAPLGTMVAIAARELYVLIFKQQPPAAPATGA